MKKILLGTTALMGAALVASAASAAEGPKVTVSGFLNSQAGYVDQDLNANQRDFLFRNDTEVHFKVDGKADNGLGYGAVIELNADVEGDANGDGFNADKTYLYLQGNWGRMEFGANTGAAHALKVDGSTFSHATGGIDGDWWLWVNPSSIAGTIISPDLPTDHGAATRAGINGLPGASEDATKVTYYTPRYAGFQLGVSYAPDAGKPSNSASSFSTFSSGGAKDIFDGGVNYTNTFSNVKVGASATGQYGNSGITGQKDLRAYALGLNLGYMGWSLGGSWGDWNDSLQSKVVGSKDANFWNAALGYDFGPFGASLGYFRSEYGSNSNASRSRLENWSLGADYKLAPGLVPYAEVTHFDINKTGTVNDNSGTVALLGTQISF